MRSEVLIPGNDARCYCLLPANLLQVINVDSCFSSQELLPEALNIVVEEIVALLDLTKLGSMIFDQSRWTSCHLKELGRESACLDHWDYGSHDHDAGVVDYP